MMTLPRTLALLAIAAWFALASACSRPGEKRCTEVCEHYLDLYITAEYDDKLARTTDPAERAALEKKRAEEREALRTDPERGFEKCVNRCNRRSRGEVADCVLEAETLDEAKACEPSDDSACQATRERPPMGTVLFFLALLALMRAARKRGWLTRAARP